MFQFLIYLGWISDGVVYDANNIRTVSLYCIQNTPGTTFIGKQINICYKLKFSSLYIFLTLCRGPLIFQTISYIAKV